MTVNAVIKIDFKCVWRTPVHVGTGNLAHDTVMGPAGAILYMRTRFFRKAGILYWRASDLCAGAVRGKVHPELVREPFLAAYVHDACERNDKR